MGESVLREARCLFSIEYGGARAMTGKRNVYTIVLGASAAIASLAGLLYSISQSFSFGSVVDPFFVGLLIANNFIIWRGRQVLQRSTYR